MSGPPSRTCRPNCCVVSDGVSSQSPRRIGHTGPLYVVRSAAPCGRRAVVSRHPHGVTPHSGSPRTPESTAPTGSAWALILLRFVRKRRPGRGARSPIKWRPASCRMWAAPPSPSRGSACSARNPRLLSASLRKPPAEGASPPAFVPLHTDRHRLRERLLLEMPFTRIAPPASSFAARVYRANAVPFHRLRRAQPEQPRQSTNTPKVTLLK